MHFFAIKHSIYLISNWSISLSYLRWIGISVNGFANGGVCVCIVVRVFVVCVCVCFSCVCVVWVCCVCVCILSVFVCVVCFWVCLLRVCLYCLAFMLCVCVCVLITVKQKVSRIWGFLYGYWLGLGIQYSTRLTSGVSRGHQIVRYLIFSQMERDWY